LDTGEWLRGLTSSGYRSFTEADIRRIAENLHIWALSRHSLRDHLTTAMRTKRTCPAAAIAQAALLFHLRRALRCNAAQVAKAVIHDRFPRHDLNFTFAVSHMNRRDAENPSLCKCSCSCRNSPTVAAAWASGFRRATSFLHTSQSNVSS
jgi:hypothetical protein